MFEHFFKYEFWKNDDTRKKEANEEYKKPEEDIYFKPAKAVSYIQLNFIATKSDVSFHEIVGSFKSTNEEQK